ncbi:MAG TPA: hypothetical protein VJ596_12975 [Gemmatimonadaceae bacterium]|nr:hypothetical protein [Gemmatimonadaceae bacterium]
MSDSAPNTEQAVTALLAERQRYESWLGTLEARRSVTPPHIYTRVQADYAARLQRVLEELSTHRSAIQEMVDSLSDRLAAVEAEEARHRDERAEAELRALVGEYAPDESDSLLRRADEELSRLGEERHGVTADLVRYRALLDAGALGPRHGAPADKGARVAATTASPTPRPDLQRHAGVYGERIWDVPDEPTAPSVAPHEPSDHRKGGGFDELEFLKSVVDSGEPGSGAHSVPRSAGAATNTATSSNDSQAGREMRESIPSFLKDVPPEQVKTLKCQECGTLNYPTEWYCERCGAELAAL